MTAAEIIALAHERGGKVLSTKLPASLTSKPIQPLTINRAFIVDANPPEPQTHVLIIPGWRPYLANELFDAHFYDRAKMKREDANTIKAYCLKQGIPIARMKRHVTIEISGRFRRFPDSDSPWKSALDALVQAKMLVDDGDKWASWDKPQFTRGKLSTAITLQDLPS